MGINSKSKSLRKAFGELVREKRLKLGLSQEAYAEKAELHRTYISSIELGKVDVGISVALKLASALGSPLHSLIKSVERKL